MLSAIIKSDIAVKTSIQIMNAFVKLRKYVSNELIEQKYINNLCIFKYFFYLNVVKYSNIDYIYNCSNY